MNNEFAQSMLGVVRWTASRPVRRATELRRQVWRLLNEQRDLLSQEAVHAIQAQDRQLDALLQAPADAESISRAMQTLEDVANTRLLPYPNGALRENVKEILVAVTVIFAFT